MALFEIRWNETIPRYKQEKWAGIGITFGNKVYLVAEIDGNRGLVIIKYNQTKNICTPKKSWRPFKKIVSFNDWNENYVQNKDKWKHYAPLNNGWAPGRNESGKTTLCGKTAIKINWTKDKEKVTCPRCKELLK